MKVLLAHNFYRSSAPSGEDAVYNNERDMLRSNGYEVVEFERRNDDIDDSTLSRKIQLARSGAWSSATYRAVTSLVRKVKPDIAHFHNTFPLISPSGYAACRENGVPVVQTIHNYRLICPGALLQRSSRPCEDCVGQSLAPALLHRCYRHSFAATAAVVWMLARNRWKGTYQHLVNRYIALTDFAATRLTAGGLPGDRISVKPNFLPDPPEMGRGDGGFVVYVGRLSEEKGLRTLLRAWESLGHLKLKILGDGPLRGELETICRDSNLNVEFLGFLAREQILSQVSRAVLQIVPSEWYEGFPLVILEAYSCGTPVVASRIGSLDELVVEGITGSKFKPGSAEDLAARLSQLYLKARNNSEIRREVRAFFENNYTMAMNIAILRDIYDETRANGG